MKSFEKQGACLGGEGLGVRGTPVWLTNPAGNEEQIRNKPRSDEPNAKWTRKALRNFGRS
jgi:hypothetical protein